MAEKLEIEYIPVAEIIPYKNNPRKNDKAVEIVAKSIKEFGFKNPVILDKNNEIVAGHTRIKAAQSLGMQEVPVIWADDLTDAQVKAFRIMDNKAQDYSYWDYNILKEEIFELKDLNIDLDITGFKPEEINFFDPDDDTNNAYLEWRKSGNLEYDNKDKMGFKTIQLHFKTEDDVKVFSKLVNQTITPKTKYLWFPKQEEDSVVNLEYTEE